MREYQITSSKLLIQALVRPIRMIRVQELRSLHAGGSSGRERAQELVDHSIMAKAIAGHGVRVHESGSSMAEQLAVAVVSVVKQRLEQSSSAVDIACLRSEGLRDLCVHVEERRPRLRVLRPIPAQNEGQKKPCAFGVKGLRKQEAHERHYLSKTCVACIEG